jgi:hypothetical protein
MRQRTRDGGAVTRATRNCALALAVALLGLSPSVRAQALTGAQMPDAKQMSGVPLPVGDLAPGTVTVRVVRGSMANVLAGETVDLVGGPSPLSAKTNAAGRAEFSGLTPGTRVKASAVVNGERLESQEFAVPRAGGIRVALVATDPEMQKKAEQDQQLAQSPAQAGMVVLGERSRFVFEMGDEALNVFGLFEIVNSARVPVRPPNPVVFDLPAESLGSGLLNGSSPQAAIAGKQVVVNGPFPPGATVVQFGYSLPIVGESLTVAQRLPIALTQVSLMAQKVGNMELVSPQIAEHRDMPLQGETFIVGKGPAVAAGQTVTFTFKGLPHHAVWPRNVALGLAVLILAAGVWGSMKRGAPAAASEERQRRLQAKRDRLFAELTTIEEQHRRHTLDPQRYTTRRSELMAALERVYAEMDGEAAA